MKYNNIKGIKRKITYLKKKKKKKNQVTFKIETHDCDKKNLIALSLSLSSYLGKIKNTP